MKHLISALVVLVTLSHSVLAKMPIGKLGLAIQSHNVQEVKNLLDRGEPPDGYNTYSTNYIPLIDAASIGFDDIVIILLDHGADINKRDGFPSRTAIIAAASRGNSDIVKLLLARGADPKGVYEAIQQKITWYQRMAELLPPKKAQTEQGAAANP